MAKKKNRVRVGKGRKPQKGKTKKRVPLAVYQENLRIQGEVEKATRKILALQERMEDAEIHINLLTRFITTLCIEKLGMRVGVLKRLLKRIESEAIRESQIDHLESLYNLPHNKAKKPPLTNNKEISPDPWDDIS